MTAPPTVRISSSASRFNVRKISALASTGVTVLPRSAKRTVFGPSSSRAAKVYGLRTRVSASSAPRPMKRFTLTSVSRGCSTASAFAPRPTSACPCSS